MPLLDMSGQIKYEHLTAFKWELLKLKTNPEFSKSAWRHESRDLPNNTSAMIVWGLVKR